MNPEAAYDLSDVYFQKLEKCKTVEEMAFVSLKMQLDYTERVRQAQSRRNRSYLSRIFKEQEGVTIQEYVTHE